MILSFVIIAVGMSNLLGMQILIPLNLDTAFLRSILTGAVINFVLNLILIPKFGANGASLSSVIAESIIVVVMYFYVKKASVHFVGIESKLMKPFCGSLLFVPLYLGLCRLFQGWWLIFIDIVCAGIIYLISQKLLKTPSLEQFLSIIRKIKWFPL